MSEAHVSVDIAQHARFGFEVPFAGTDLSPVLTDQPPPLGEEGRGPNPVRLLAASLSFALEKQRVDLQPVSARIDVGMMQNDAGRVRVGAMAVTLSVGKTWMRRVRTRSRRRLRPLPRARRESACATSARRSCARSPSARHDAGAAPRAAS